MFSCPFEGLFSEPAHSLFSVPSDNVRKLLLLMISYDIERDYWHERANYSKAQTFS